MWKIFILALFVSIVAAYPSDPVRLTAGHADDTKSEINKPRVATARLVEDVPENRPSIGGILVREKREDELLNTAEQFRGGYGRGGYGGYGGGRGRGGGGRGRGGYGGYGRGR